MARLTILDAARNALMEANQDPNCVGPDPTDPDGYIWLRPLPNEIQWHVNETVAHDRVCLFHFENHVGSKGCDAVIRFTRDCGRRW